MILWLLRVEKISPIDRNFYTGIIAIILLIVLISLVLYMGFNWARVAWKRVANMGTIVLKSNSATEAYNNMEETVITLNEVGIIVSCNPALGTMFGYEEEDLVGKESIKVLLDEHFWLDFENFKTFHIPLNHLEVDAVRKSGVKFPVSISLKKGVGEIDKNKVLLLVTIRDISHRRGNEEFKLKKQLEASRAFAMLAFGERSLKSGTWEWYLAGDNGFEKNEVVLSPNARKIFGVDEGKKVHSTDLMDLLHEDDKQKVGDAFLKGLTNKEDYRVEYRLFKRNSKCDLIDCKGTMVLDENGEVIRIRGTIQIIAENVT